MTDREAFIAAIAANPEENTPRLAFADWLDEHDEPARAEFIRLQCRLADLELTHPTFEARWANPQFQELHRRASELLDTHERKWLGGFLRAAGIGPASDEPRRS